VAFKAVVEQVIKDEISDVEFADFIVFSAVERLFLESAQSADFQVLEAMRRGEGPLQAALGTLQYAQATLQALSRHYPDEVLGLVAKVWENMEFEERRDKGMGFHVLMERYKEQKNKQRKAE
jgi:hypothetical protein